MKPTYFCFLFISCFCFISQATQKTKAPIKPLSSSKNQKAQLILKQALNNYHLKTLQIKIKQEIFLPAIKISMKSQGTLSLKGEKFHLSLKGNPSSLILFDGKFLWYQADTSEKVVFKLKDFPPIQILTNLFNAQKFFEHFHIEQAKKKSSSYIFQLLTNEKIEGLSEVFIKVHSHIAELRLIWQGLENWQKYTFSKPLSKKLPDSYFQFSTSGFQVITKM